jgi:hypothetical protein
MKHKKRISTVRNIGKHRLCSFIAHCSLYTLQGLTLPKSFITVKDTGPANAFIVLKIGDVGYNLVLCMGQFAQKQGKKNNNWQFHKPV